jgi:hypothetical protein
MAGGNGADDGANDGSKRGLAFEIGVEAVVPEHGQGAESGCHHAAHEPKRGERDGGEHAGQDRGAGRRNLARWNRTSFGALHQGVQLVFLGFVEGAGGEGENQDRARNGQQAPAQGVGERQIAGRGRYRRHDRNRELEQLGEIAAVHESPPLLQRLDEGDQVGHVLILQVGFGHLRRESLHHLFRADVGSTA